MTIGKVEVTVKFTREIDTADFVTDADREDLDDEDDEVELTLEEAAERLAEQYGEGEVSVEDEAGFVDASVEVRVIGGR